MKYGDIVVYKNQIGTVVKSENDFKFHPCNYGGCYFSELNTITDEDVREATPDEKLELIRKEFTWSKVIDINVKRITDTEWYFWYEENGNTYGGYVDVYGKELDKPIE